MMLQWRQLHHFQPLTITSLLQLSKQAKKSLY